MQSTAISSDTDEILLHSQCFVIGDLVLGSLFESERTKDTQIEEISTQNRSKNVIDAINIVELLRNIAKEGEKTLSKSHIHVFIFQRGQKHSSATRVSK